MKNLFILLGLFLSSVVGKAQITLEHTYPANEGHILIYNLQNVGYRYMTFDNFHLVWAPKIHLYDGSHNLWKSIDPKIPTGYVLTMAKFPSTMLFDLDTGVEVVVIYNRTSGGPSGPDYITQIVDENGSVLSAIQHGQDALIQKFDSTWKLLVYMQDPTSNTNRVWSAVYSLPGQFLGVRNPNSGNNDPADLLYPNPMGNTATLEYTLPDGAENGTVRLFNASGTLIRSYPVNQHTGKLLIQRDGLPSGAYIISTNSNGVASPPQKILMY